MGIDTTDLRGIKSMQLYRPFSQLTVSVSRGGKKIAQESKRGWQDFSLDTSSPLPFPVLYGV